jgi:hypothetical protein
MLTDADRVGQDLFRVWLVDVADADADVVAVEVNGRVTGRYVIGHSPIPVTIAAPGGVAPPVDVLAVSDGSARNIVTVGIRTSGGAWISDWLAVGARQRVPLTLAQ